MQAARASGTSAGHASTALRRPPKEKVPFSPLRRQYGGVPADRQSVAGPRRPGNGGSGTGRPPRLNILPEEGLEPTRTYAQALLRRPRLPFRHSGGAASISEYARWELIRDGWVKQLERRSRPGGPGPPGRSGGVYPIDRAISSPA